MPICGSFGIRLDFGENIPHSPDNLRWNYDLQAEVAAATGKLRNCLCLWLGIADPGLIDVAALPSPGSAIPATIPSWNYSAEGTV